MITTDSLGASAGLLRLPSWVVQRTPAVGVLVLVTVA